jgi:hypothetical protein
METPQVEIPMTDAMRRDIAMSHARELCTHHIRGHYPEYKQLNILMSGDEAEKSKMSTFIAACRAWSNGDNPDPAALAAITP